MRIVTRANFLLYIFIYFMLSLIYTTKFIFPGSQHSSKTNYSSIISCLSEWYHHPSNRSVKSLEVIFHGSLPNIPHIILSKGLPISPPISFQKHLFPFTCSTTTLVQAVTNSLLTTAKASFT